MRVPATCRPSDPTALDVAATTRPALATRAARYDVIEVASTSMAASALGTGAVYTTLCAAPQIAHWLTASSPSAVGATTALCGAALLIAGSVHCAIQSRRAQTAIVDAGRHLGETAVRSGRIDRALEAVRAIGVAVPLSAAVTWAEPAIGAALLAVSALFGLPSASTAVRELTARYAAQANTVS